MRARLLPVLIGAAGLLLVSKVANVITTVAPAEWFGHPLSIVAQPAQATETTHPDPAPKPAPKPALATQTVVMTGVVPGPEQKPAVASDPPPEMVTAEQRRLLEDLRSRKSEWDARDHAVSEREGMLSAVEQRLVARAAELASLQARLESLDKARTEREEANWNGLVKLYETMRPQQAAVIFNDMDMPVLLQIADRMKDAKAAAVLALMQPDRARLLTGQIAAKRTHATLLPSEASAQ